MILSIILALFSSHFSLQELDVEMSMDTYPYGVDASPMVQTIGGKSPTIDSITVDHIYGKIGPFDLMWDEDGSCVVPLCLEGDDLIWSDKWLNH